MVATRRVTVKLESGDTSMKQTAFAFLALALSLSLWPATRTLAALGGIHQLVATQLSRWRIPDRLAMSDQDDNDRGYHHKHGKRKQQKSKSEEDYEHQQFCGPYFRSSQVPYFRNYYSQNNYANLPPGLWKHIQKKGQLPPGLEKKYERTGQLPPGLQKRLECGQTVPPDYRRYFYPVPASAYEQFGPLPPDTSLQLYGNDLILLNEHTRAIVDILRGAY